MDYQPNMMDYPMNFMSILNQKKCHRQIKNLLVAFLFRTCTQATSILESGLNPVNFSGSFW